MKHILPYPLNEIQNHYAETSWSDNIEGVNQTITISDVENYLSATPVIEIAVAVIKNMCVHVNKTSEKTKQRAASANLDFPIIISRDFNGEYNMILDGHHRLLKAIILGNEFIKAKVLNLNSAPKLYQKMFT